MGTSCPSPSLYSSDLRDYRDHGVQACRDVTVGGGILWWMRRDTVPSTNTPVAPFPLGFSCLWSLRLDCSLYTIADPFVRDPDTVSSASRFHSGTQSHDRRSRTQIGPVKTVGCVGVEDGRGTDLVWG